MLTLSVPFSFCASLLATALFTSACGPVTPGTSEEKIFGGTKVPAGEWQGTVAITSFLGMHCSGTAITPKVVITAGHCADASIGSTYVYVGEGKSWGLMKGQYKAKRVVASPLYAQAETGWNDIAYILLEKPLDLPASAYIPVLVDEAEMQELIDIGARSHLVGFGNREDGGTGKKYEVDAPITSFNDNEVTIGGDGLDSCQGDSGGPAYGQLANGEWRVYGVVSRGGACGTGGQYGRMNANICWIQEHSGEDLGLPKGYCDKSTTTNAH